MIHIYGQFKNNDPVLIDKLPSKKLANDLLFQYRTRLNKDWKVWIGGN